MHACMESRVRCLLIPLSRPFMHVCEVHIKLTQQCLQAALEEALRQFVRYKSGPGVDAARPHRAHSLGAAAQNPVSSHAPSQGLALPPAQPPLGRPVAGTRAAPSGAVSRSETESSEASSGASSSLSAHNAAAPGQAAAAARQGAGATAAPKQAPAPAAARQPAAGQQGAGGAAAPKQAPAAAGPGARPSSSSDITSSGSYETDSDAKP